MTAGRAASPSGPVGGSSPLGRAAATSAALGTAVVAIGAALVADAHPSHIAVLALAAAALAVLRFLFAGAHNGLFSVVSGAMVAQPALYASLELLPALGAAGPVSTVTGLHIAVTTTVVAAVTGAQSMCLAIASPTVSRLRRALASIPADAARGRTSGRHPLATRRLVGAMCVATSPGRSPPGSPVALPV
ncbi:hypothetical protein [Gordonia soli]|uniref:Uncharacterized protein n=1 Tax=Gordonia soli NBRC 108243 TaxID=1223545 RepID=M0QF70_9ACTN|nr:hypothetical protein [Gordonia soli]GAC66941.1 hypothetical protein GS4_05_01530 [Gordonia soli NBRC 108243]